MRGRKIDFYAANLVHKLKLFSKNPSYIGFYLSRFMKYNSLNQFDAFIISYPKSGRTWLQKLIIESIKEYNNTKVEIADISELYSVVKNFPKILSTHAGSSWEEKIKDKEEIKVDDFNKYKHAKSIFLFRDPRDVLVSQFYHIVNRTNYESFDKNCMIENPNVGLEKIIAFMNKWKDYAQKNKTQIVEVSYEGLKQNTSNSIKKLFEHLDYNINSEILNKAIDACTLQKMRAKESAKAGNPWSNTSSKNENSFHSRKGIVGEYNSFFNKKEIEKINKIIKEKLNPQFNY